MHMKQDSPRVFLITVMMIVALIAIVAAMMWVLNISLDAGASIPSV